MINKINFKKIIKKILKKNKKETITREQFQKNKE